MAFNELLMPASGDERHAPREPLAIPRNDLIVGHCVNELDQFIDSALPIGSFNFVRLLVGKMDCQVIRRVVVSHTRTANSAPREASRQQCAKIIWNGPRWNARGQTRVA